MSGQLPRFGPAYDMATMNRFADYIEQMLRGCITNRMELVRHPLDPSQNRHSGILTEPYGGTDQSTYATGDILYASAPDTLSKRAIGVAGQQLVVGVSGVPEWSSTSSTLQVVSGSALSALRVITASAASKAVYASNSTTTHADKAYGMTLQAVSAADQLVLVLLSGYHYDIGWNWNTSLPIFLGVNGQMTQTPPVAPAFAQVIAKPITTQSINFAPELALL